MTAIRPLISLPGPGTNDKNLYTQMAITVNELINQVVAGGGTVTHSGALTLGRLIIGNGGADIKVGDLSGDVSTSGGTVTTLASVVSAGTNTKITYNAKGLVTAGAAAVLASADFANQGTTTTVLHGNAPGNPSWGAISLTADITGTLGLSHGGLGSTTGAGTISAGSDISTDESTNSVTYTDLTTPGPSVTLTTGTSAIVFLSANAYCASTIRTGFISVDVSGSTTLAANDNNSSFMLEPIANGGLTCGRSVTLTGLTAGSNTFTLKYRIDNSASSFHFRNRAIAVLAL